MLNWLSPVVGIKHPTIYNWFVVKQKLSDQFITTNLYCYIPILEKVFALKKSVANHGPIFKELV